MCKGIKIVRVACVSSALALANGCANFWLKPGATKQSFNDDKAQCVAQAYLAAPITQMPVHLGAGYSAPGSATCIEYGNLVNCTGYPGPYVPPSVMSVDLNAQARTAMVDACMRGLGYTRVKLGIGGGAATITQAPVAEADNSPQESLKQTPGECSGVGPDDCARGE